MNKTWIKQKNRARLILFFNGWGMDKSAINHVESNEYDVIEFNDYNILNFCDGEFRSYAEIYVVAWSLGVFAASLVLANTSLPIKKSIAINGTANPVNAKEGIHPEIFKGTLEGWNEKNRVRFLMRTVGGKRNFEDHRLKFGERLIQNQKDELATLYGYSQNNIETAFYFDTVITGYRDTIFQKENQMNYWKNKCMINVLDIPHYPFLHFTIWDNIITM